MATLTGKLASAKPAAATNTALYRAPIDSSASGVLNMVSDGTAADVRVGVKKYDLAVTLDAATYKLHRGDVITNRTFTFDSSIPILTDQTDTFVPGQLVTSDDGEKSFRWESYYVPPTTDFYLKKVTITSFTLENQTGEYSIGETVDNGTGVSAVVYDIIPGSFGGSTLFLGPRTGGTFAEGDTLTGASSTASGDISVGGIGVARTEVVFSNSGAAGIYALRRSDTIILLLDRTYRFYVQDASMSGVSFGLSTTINGTFGIDELAGTSDDGQEYIIGKTTNGTAGNAGAYVQFDMSQNGGGDALYYYYDNNDGTLGGGEQSLRLSTDYAYDTIYVYDVKGAWTNSSDSITLGQNTFTVTSNAGSKWGYIQSVNGAAITLTTGDGSADFVATDTFYDAPFDGGSARSLVTINSVDVAATAVTDTDWIVYDKIISGDTRLTSLVIGPGQALIVYASTQNIIFDYSGFQDTSSDITLRSFDRNATPGGVGASGG